MEAYADSVAQFLDDRNLTQIVLVGSSMGGVVAQHFALRHPAKLLRLLLVSTGAVMADPVTALAKADAIAAAPWDEDAVRPFVQGFFRKPLSAKDFDRYREIALMASHQAAIEAFRSNARSSTLDRLHQITAPCLIIQGRHDQARTPEHGADMCDRIPGARLEVLEESGHTPQLEEPEAFHKIALPFLVER
jgi:pimeloyl-ACP methyl ester carboxylesterase